MFLDKSLIAEDPTPVPEVSIFENTQLCVKLKQLSKTQRLPFSSTTSSIRFQKNGLYRQALINQAMKWGYYLNLSDETMNKIYEKGLSLNSKY